MEAAAPDPEAPGRELAVTAVEAGARRYFADRRQRIKPFIDAHFSLNGTLKLHRAALGWDIPKAPLNLSLAAPQLAMQVGAIAAGRMGAKKAQTFLKRSILLETSVSREIEWLVHTELLELPIAQKKRQSQHDALSEAILGEPIVAEAVEGALREIGRHGGDPVFRERLHHAMTVYGITRNAAAEITTGLLNLGAGAVALNKLTPGAMSLGPALAAVLSQQAAVNAFPLGGWLGGMWYGFFPVAPGLGLVMTTTGGLMLASRRRSRPLPVSFPTRSSGRRGCISGGWRRWSTRWRGSSSTRPRLASPCMTITSRGWWTCSICSAPRCGWQASLTERSFVRPRPATLPLSADVSVSITVEQVACRGLGRKEPALGHATLEGLAEARIHRPGMQADADRLGVPASGLDGEVAEDHVQRRLRGAIGVPAAGAVIADAADAGGERREHSLAARRHQRQQVLRHQRRPHRVEAKALHQRNRIERAVGFLGLRKTRPLQGAGRDDDQSQWRGKRGGGGDNARLVRDVDPRGAVEGPRKREHRRERRVVVQLRHERAADAARCANDDGAAIGLEVAHLPAHAAGDAFEGTDQIPRDPAAVEAARLWRNGFVTDEALVHHPGIDGQMIADRCVSWHRVGIAPASAESALPARADAPIDCIALPLAEAAS